MINVQEFLLKNNIQHGTYALVTYDNKIEATWFTKYNFGKGDWFLESPCMLYKLLEVKEDVDMFCKEFIRKCVCLEEGESEEDYINQFVKPMIIDNWLYEIENFQCSPYLPKEVDYIKTISEKECLEYMLSKSK